MALFCSLIAFVRAAKAADKELQVQGLVISPFTFEEHIQKGQTIERLIRVTNTTDDAVRLAVSVRDFIPVGTSGQARFLPAKDEADPHFSIVDWITITRQPEFVLQPQETTTLEFNITPPTDADETTHYGGIVFTFTDRQNTTNSAGSTVLQSIGATIIAKLGKANGNGAITSFTTSKHFYTTPTASFQTNFTNSGDVHLTPKGKIEIKNWFGHLTGLGYINPNGQIVLPKTERLFTSSYKKPFMFGKYTAEAIVWFGEPKLESRKVATFWVLPVKPMIAFLCISLCIIIFGTLGLRRYKAWVINKAFTTKK